MLKRITFKKIIVTTAVIFALLLIYLIPGVKDDELEFNQELEYVDTNITKSSIYLLDSKNNLAYTNIIVSSDKKQIEKRAKEILEILIMDGSGESKIPSGFRSILPSDTKILSINYDNKLMKVNFSKEILEINKNLEEKMIEAIVFSLTSIDDIDKVIIYVEGEILTKLPKTGLNLPSTLDRSYGINKHYDISSRNNINNTTIYYIDKHNNDIYYVPVTKYTNDTREKISIIIDELSTSYTYNTGLMSYLNANTKLLAVEKEENKLKLFFNNYIFEDFDNKNILEEVINTISYSIYDNYNIDEVIFIVDNQEIYKSVSKTLE
ncbi:MAG TPA: GerMN domain-containing protein [Tenericutes bacterium]|nr:GerMN domain-containing protein [Mycoplasmatota bacterium]